MTGLLGARDAFAGQAGGARIVTQVQGGPGRPEQQPGLEVRSRRGGDAQGGAQELASLAVPAGGDPPPGEPGGQFPSCYAVLATERP